MLERGDCGANSWLMRSSELGAEQRPRGLVQQVKAMFGNCVHLWMWDEHSIAAALQRAGFTDIRRCKFNDSTDPAFQLVEARDRFYEPAIGAEECAMEARKP
jgi:hypothetical protein